MDNQQKSTGHLGFFGDLEYILVGNLIFSAKISSSIEENGRRKSYRFEDYQSDLESSLRRARKYDKNYFHKDTENP